MGLISGPEVAGVGRKLARKWPEEERREKGGRGGDDVTHHGCDVILLILLKEEGGATWRHAIGCGRTVGPTWFDRI